MDFSASFTFGFGSNKSVLSNDARTLLERIFELSYKIYKKYIYFFFVTLYQNLLVVRNE